MPRHNAHRSIITKDGKPATRSERHRESIKVGLAVRYLHDVIEDKKPADPHKINAAKFLISKVIPAPEPLSSKDPLAGAKDISGIAAHVLLAQIEGRGDTVTVDSE